MPSIQITDRAVEAIRQRQERRGTSAAPLRFGVRGGGCNGFTYAFDFDDQPPRENDFVIEKAGVRVLVDGKSMALVDGTTIDFEPGIRGHGFRFMNPRAKGTCGCGESVTF